MTKIELEYKFCQSSDISLEEKICKDGVKRFVINGYANTKNNIDSYGDFAQSLDGSSVYDLTRYNMNPVLLIDHKNSAGCIVGKTTSVVEDSVGLNFSAELMPLDECYTPEVKHAVSCAMNKMVRGISIAGFSERDNPKDASQMTKFHVFEISLVAVPADELSLTKKSGDKKESSLNWNLKKIRLSIMLANETYRRI